ncbi:MAG: GNAT family N-acetyltransferase [Candidatus Spyradocola sp.]
MPALYDEFPHLEDDRLVIRKMQASDVDALAEITGNEQVYRYIPPLLYKKSRGNLLAAIRNLGGRDFEKKKCIIAGIYLKSEGNRLIGLAEILDYKRRANAVTIGYRLNQAYWHRGIATAAVRLMVEYLTKDMGIGAIQAFVMPENQYSAKVLLANGFVKETEPRQEHNWGGCETVTVDVYRYTAE